MKDGRAHFINLPPTSFLQDRDNWVAVLAIRRVLLANKCAQSFKRALTGSLTIRRLFYL
jgi:hypothetical protein